MSGYHPISRGWPENKKSTAPTQVSRVCVEGVWFNGDAIDRSQNFCLDGTWFHWNDMTLAQKIKKARTKIAIAESCNNLLMEQRWNKLLKLLEKGIIPVEPKEQLAEVAVAIPAHKKKKGPPKTPSRMARTLALWAAQHALGSLSSAEEKPEAVRDTSLPQSPL